MELTYIEHCAGSRVVLVHGQLFDFRFARLRGRGAFSPTAVSLPAIRRERRGIRAGRPVRTMAALALSASYVFWSVETKRADVPAVNTMSLAARDLEDVRTTLYAIQALAQVLGLDPAHEFDRTALAALIEREASRASGIVDALINRDSD